MHWIGRSHEGTLSKDALATLHSSLLPPTPEGRVTEQVVSDRPDAEDRPCSRGPQTGDQDRREIAFRMPSHHGQVLHYGGFI